MKMKEESEKRCRPADEIIRWELGVYVSDAHII